MIFDIGETVICSCEVRDDAGILKDPDTSINIAINRSKPLLEIISSIAMTKDSTGKYHYEFASAGNSVGEYEAIYTATDAGRITIQKESFNLE